MRVGERVQGHRGEHHSGLGAALVGVDGRVVVGEPAVLGPVVAAALVDGLEPRRPDHARRRGRDRARGGSPPRERERDALALQEDGERGRQATGAEAEAVQKVRVARGKCRRQGPGRRRVRGRLSSSAAPPGAPRSLAKSSADLRQSLTAARLSEVEQRLRAEGQTPAPRRRR